MNGDKIKLIYYWLSNFDGRFRPFLRKTKKIIFWSVSWPTNYHNLKFVLQKWICPIKNGVVAKIEYKNIGNRKPNEKNLSKNKNTNITFFHCLITECKMVYFPSKTKKRPLVDHQSSTTFSFCLFYFV